MVAACTLFATEAEAGVLYFHYLGSGVNANADFHLITQDTINPVYGGYNMLSASGTWNGVAIDGMVPPSGVTTNNGNAIYDNVVYTVPGLSPFDNPGWLFQQGSLFINTYSVVDTSTAIPTDPDYAYLYPDTSLCGNPGCQFDTSSLTTDTNPPVKMPEPLTASMFGAGLAGAMKLRRRKKKLA